MQNDNAGMAVQTWLQDAKGQTYTSALRLAFVDDAQPA